MNLNLKAFSPNVKNEVRFIFLFNNLFACRTFRTLCRGSTRFSRLNASRRGLSRMYRGSIPTSLTRNSILRISFSSETPKILGCLHTAMETTDSEQPRVLLKNSILAATFSLELQATAATTYLNIRELRGTPSSSARSKTSFTRSRLNVSNFGLFEHSVAISRTPN
ncbi:hypothetical protein PVAP13_4NG079419 [Panicum virgatum]|uniref:Uncharacterized protein n=1 Tax=Panicum virgatum TaxID=38727 RepID=A0A8T0T7R1_PANVG|nr:hypothetical protein PVAP13_4NG079419 [Panicum virgatum]